MMVTHGKPAVPLPLALALFAIASGPAPGRAATPDASVGLFLTDAVGTCSSVTPFGCEADPLPTLAGNLNTPYYVFLAVFNGDPELGIAGRSCGIDYNAGSTVVHQGELCSPEGQLQFPNHNWPSPGGGNRITFNAITHCQTNEPEGNGVTAIFGYFYVTAYGSDRMSIITNDVGQAPELTIAECEPPAETNLDPATRAGYVGFSSDGSEEGDLPCVEKTETTWGRLKSNDWGN
jgi:hypothetical protein